MITPKKLLDALAYQIPEYADPDNGYTKFVQKKIQQPDAEGMIDFKNIEEAKQFKDDFIADEVKVTVFDAVMGTGKSTGAIDFALIQDMPLIILVELDSEVDRYLETLEVFGSFTSPKRITEVSGGRKRDALQKLVVDKANIVTTHSLFESWTQETLEHIELNEYTLILDEVYSGIYGIYPKVGSDDIETLMRDGYLEVDEDNVLHTTDKPIYDRYKDFYNVINTKKCYRFIQDKDTYIIKELNPNLFEAFKSIIVLTYMFEGSLLKNFLELNHIDCQLKSFDMKGNITDYHQPDGSQFRSLITFSGTPRNFSFYSGIGNLSDSWFKNSKKTHPKRSKKNNFISLRQTASTIARSWTDSGISKECIAWTTHKAYAEDLSDSRFDNKRVTLKKFDDSQGLTDEEIHQLNFISQTARGTNNYRHKTHLLYLTNFFSNPIIGNFLQSKAQSDKAVINQDAYSLSTLLQWIWRGAIRDGQEITVFIPARRPRHLLMKWLGFADNELY